MESNKENIEKNLDFFEDVNTINIADQKDNEIKNNIDYIKENLELKEQSLKESEKSDEVSLENIDEDLYLQELYLRLTKMKQERKKAEDNAKTLDNRLNLLKGEEIKVIKKIEMTKKKANDKFQNLQFIAKHNNMKNESKKKKENDFLLKKEQNKLMNETIKNNTKKNKDKLKRHIEEEAKLLKIQKIYNKQLINFLNEEKMNENRTKFEKIKNAKILYEEQKRMNNNEKKRKLREELEKKLIEEYRLKENAENKRIEAELQEIEIIKKLQNTTKLQQNIADEYAKMNIDTVMKGDYNNYINSNKNNFNNKRKTKIKGKNNQK